MSEPDASPLPAEANQKKSSPSPWTNVLILFGILVVGGLGVLFAFVWLAKETVDAGRETVIEIAEAFQPETITQTFVEWSELEARGTDGNILEVATAESTETFTRKTNLKLFDRVIPLGTTISEISVPAIYRFHIDLNGDWFLTTDGQRVMVIAPTIEPSLPVAFDTARMKKKSKSGWARWDGNESLETLEKSLTAQLGDRARAPGTVSKVREESRLAVAKFVQNWLISRAHWNDRAFSEISVVFEDEIKGDGKVVLSDQPATLMIDTADKIQTGSPETGLP